MFVPFCKSSNSYYFVSVSILNVVSGKEKKVLPFLVFTFVMCVCVCVCKHTHHCGRSHKIHCKSESQGYLAVGNSDFIFL